MDAFAAALDFAAYFGHNRDALRLEGHRAADRAHRERRRGVPPPALPIRSADRVIPSHGDGSRDCRRCRGPGDRPNATLAEACAGIEAVTARRFVEALGEFGHGDRRRQGILAFVIGQRLRCPRQASK